MTENSEVRRVDVVVLGGGTGGTAAAKAATQSGASVVMFNDGELGGLCILRGCMPTKTLLHAAHLVHEAAHHRTPGIGHADLTIDFPQVMANKSAKVARFKKAKLNAIDQGGYEVVDARASFVGRNTVEAGGVTYRFDKGAVIATGSTPAIPPIEGIDDVPVWTSDDLLEMETVPDSAVVIGVGAIGLESSQFLARVGCQTTVLSRRPVLCDLGSEFHDEMTAALAAEPNLTLRQKVVMQRVRKTAGGIAIDISDEKGTEAIEATRLVVATGRHPAVRGLGLERAGINVQPGSGHIVFGLDMCTTNPRVFVAGDVTGTRQILHIANEEGRVAGLCAAQVPGTHQVNPRMHMEVTFTDPPIANLGMTPEEAKHAGVDTVTSKANFSGTGRAITMDVAFGVIQLVARRDGGEIIGCQILGPRADDLIHAISPIMHYRGTAAHMLEMPWYHPTLSEVLLGLARDIQGQVSDEPVPDVGA